MARTKQTARKSRGGKAPRKALRGRASQQDIRFKDHNGDPYIVVGGRPSDCNDPPAIAKLSIQLYSLEELKPSAASVAEQLLTCPVMSDCGNRTNYWPRMDVYLTPQRSIEDCVSHHRREKQCRHDAVTRMKQAAMDQAELDIRDRYTTTTSSPSSPLPDPDDIEDEITEAKATAVQNLRGREPHPHIMPTWSRPRTQWHEYDTHQRHENMILIIPPGCKTWTDVQARGLWFVKFDLDVTPDMETIQYDCDPVYDADLDGYVEIEKVHWGPSTSIRRACVHPPPPLPFSLFTGVFKETVAAAAVTAAAAEENVQRPVQQHRRWTTDGCDVNLGDAWSEMTAVLYDCTYRPVSCDGCDDDLTDHECEVEMDEHYFDTEGYCIACRRHDEYRRRSKRVARRKRIKTKS